MFDLIDRIKGWLAPSKPKTIYLNTNSNENGVRPFLPSQEQVPSVQRQEQPRPQARVSPNDNPRGYFDPEVENYISKATNEFPTISKPYLRSLYKQESQAGRMKPPKIEDFAGPNGWQVGLRKTTFSSPEFKKYNLKADTVEDVLRSAAAISADRKRRWEISNDEDLYMRGYYTDIDDDVARKRIRQYLADYNY